MSVPFLDLKTQYQEIEEEIQTAIDEVFDSGWFILGKNVELFEQEFASYLNAGFAIGVSSGTSALQLSLLAYGVGLGDEVITTPNTAFPTVAAISSAGATPVFADIDPSTYNIDSSKIEGKITKKTKAIIPVHLYGQMADIETVMLIAAKHNLWVIEDACQAHGANLNSQKAGTFGNLGCFSFYPTKNLGSYGDSGIVATNDSSLADKVRLLRNYGETERYHHVIKGLNSRMDELQAAILRVKLIKLDTYNKLRRQKANVYHRLLKGVGDLVLPEEKSGYHVYHLYVIRTKYRNKLRDFLTKNSVQTQIHYPIPVHLQEAYSDLKLEKGVLPCAEKVSGEILSLPLYPEIRNECLELIAEKIKQFYG